MHVILGMHKSGTTACARALHESGVYMGPFMPGLQYHSCKYEDPDLRRINNDLLRSHNKESIDSLGPVVETQDIIIKASEFVSSRVTPSGSGGLKDPRLTLTYDFWKERLSVDSVIFCFRDFDSILHHYLRRAVSWKIMHGRGLVNRVFSAWCIYNKNALRVLRESRVPCLIVDFNEDVRPFVLSRKLSEFFDLEVKDIVSRKNELDSRTLAQTKRVVDSFTVDKKKLVDEITSQIRAES